MPKRRLTKQQQRRIQEQIGKRRQQLQRREQKRLAELEQLVDRAGELGVEQEGRIITHFGHSLAIEDSHGELHYCVARQNIGSPVCGDRVVWQATRSDDGVVTAILPRSSLLKRPGFADQVKPVAANITLMVIVFAPMPEPQEELIDRYLVAAEHLKLTPLLLLNKVDLIPADKLPQWQQRFAVYETLGYELIYASSQSETGMQALRGHLKGNISIFVGQSGVGKSSLINTLLPDLNLRTQSLSELSQLGQHTTSNSTLYHLPGNGGDLIDSPGVRDFRLSHLQREEIAQGFVEFRPFLGKCRFSDCRHQSEPDCAIKAAVSDGKITPARLQSFLRLTG